MKKTLLLIAIALFQVYAFGQTVKGISVGVTPFGSTGVRTTSDKTDLVTHHYSFSQLAYHASFEYNSLSMIDLFYAKEVFGTGVALIETNHIALYRMQSYNFNAGKRFQIPIHYGFGLSYYTEPIPTKLYFDLGARLRLKVYVTNTLAVYAGGYYFLGFSGNKNAKYVSNRKGVEAGLTFNF